jgi:hypothetical protein
MNRWLTSSSARAESTNAQRGLRVDADARIRQSGDAAAFEKRRSDIQECLDRDFGR